MVVPLHDSRDSPTPQRVFPNPPHLSLHPDIASSAGKLFQRTRILSPYTVSRHMDMSAMQSRKELDSPQFHQVLSVNGQTVDLLPATVEDTPEFVDLFFSIFRNELVFRAMYGTASWPLVTARTIRQWREELEVEPKAARLRWYKVVNSSGYVYFHPSQSLKEMLTAS